MTKVVAKGPKSRKGQHVVPNGNKWSIRKAGSERASGTFDTQKEAVENAKKLRKIKRLNFTFTAGMEEFVKETPMEKTLIHLVDNVAIGNTCIKTSS